MSDSVRALSAMAQDHINKERERSAILAMFDHAQAIVAATVPKLHRVASSRPRRWRWRYGINAYEAGALFAASVIRSSVAIARR